MRSLCLMSMQCQRRTRPCFIFHVCYNTALILYRYILLEHCYLCLVSCLCELRLREHLFQFFYSTRLIVPPQSRCNVFVFVIVHSHAILTLDRHPSIRRGRVFEARRLSRWWMPKHHRIVRLHHSQIRQKRTLRILSSGLPVGPTYSCMRR